MTPRPHAMAGALRRFALLLLPLLALLLIISDGIPRSTNSTWHVIIAYTLGGVVARAVTPGRDLHA